jgi:AraC-like DNA-binding protein
VVQIALELKKINILNDHGVKDYAIINDPPFPANWQVSPHRHSQLEIGLVKSESCTIQLGSERRYFEMGDVFFFPARLAHGFATGLTQGVEIVVVQFPELEESLTKKLLNLPPIGFFKLTDLEMSVFLDLCYRLQREIVGSLPFAEMQCRALLQQIIVLLLRTSSRGDLPYLIPQQQHAIEKALQIIHLRNQDNLRVREIATEVGFSSQHFRELFKRYVGISPKRYLTTLKIQRSKCLLLHKEYSVTDVAYHLGFSSSQQFSKAFRKTIGLSPLLWRKAYMLQDESVLSEKY